MNKTTNRTISFLQTFGIILVVAGHLGDVDSVVWRHIHTWIYNFHMPLFMFISGWLMRLTRPGYDLAPGRFVARKAARLLVPYVVLSSLALVPKALLDRWAYRPVDFTFGGWVESLLVPWDNAIVFFWFLPTLFLIFVLVAFGLRWTRSHWIVAALMAVSLFFNLSGIAITRVLNLTGVAEYLLWWGGGYYFAMCGGRVIGWLKLGSPVVCVVLFVLTISQVVWPVVIVRVVAGIMFSISLALLYTGRGCRMLDHIDGYSFSIYLLSWFVQVPVRIVGLDMLGLPWPVVWLASVAGGIYLPLLVARMVRTRLPGRRFLRLVVGI